MTGGIAVAKKKGVKFGRRKIYNAEDYIDIYLQVKNKEISVNEAIETIGHSASNYYRIMAEIEKMHINQP